MQQDPFQKLRERVAVACNKAARSPQDVKILLATKTVSVERIQQAQAMGFFLFGENKVQEGKQKWPLLPQATWHFIGHLQSNKVKDVLPYNDVIQSVDSLGLVEAIDKRASILGKRQKIYLEVNTSGESSKEGVAPSDFFSFLEESLAYKHVQICGLMTLALPSPEEAKVRACFRSLRDLREQAQKKYPQLGPLELSMGMSNDFEWAIEEGSTLIRIGSLVFGSRL